MTIIRNARTGFSSNCGGRCAMGFQYHRAQVGGFVSVIFSPPLSLALGGCGGWMRMIVNAGGACWQGPAGAQCGWRRPVRAWGPVPPPPRVYAGSAARLRRRCVPKVHTCRCACPRATSGNPEMPRRISLDTCGGSAASVGGLWNLRRPTSPLMGGRKVPWRATCQRRGDDVVR